MNANRPNNSTTYDEISEKSQQSESVSQRKNVIKSKFEQFLETKKPHSLLDLGCGSGVFAIIAKKSGVEKVIGVDISSTQIKIAKDKTKSLGLEIEYLIQDITFLKVEHQFDVISSVFGFCYAPSHQILSKQLMSAYAHLNVNGHIFAVVSHPQHPTRDWGESYRVYAQDILKDGAKLKCDFLIDGEVVATDYKFYWTKQTWEKTFEDIGFNDISWEELDEHSTNIIFKAKKT